MSSWVFKDHIFIIADWHLFSLTAFSPSQFLILRNLGVTVKPFPPPTIQNHTTPFYDVNCTSRPAYYKHYHHITIGRRRGLTYFTRAAGRHTVHQYHTVPQQIIQWHTTPYHSLSCHTIPYPSLSHHNTPSEQGGHHRDLHFAPSQPAQVPTGTRINNNLLIISFPIIVRVINAWPEMFQSHVFTRKIADVAYTSWH